MTTPIIMMLLVMTAVFWLPQAIKHLMWARRRKIDRELLWPMIKDHATSLEQAREAFAHHAFHDPAWVDFYGENRLGEIVEELQ